MQPNAHIHYLVYNSLDSLNYDLSISLREITSSSSVVWMFLVGEATCWFTYGSVFERLNKVKLNGSYLSLTCFFLSVVAAGVGRSGCQEHGVCLGLEERTSPCHSDRTLRQSTTPHSFTFKEKEKERLTIKPWNSETRGGETPEEDLDTSGCLKRIPSWENFTSFFSTEIWLNTELWIVHQKTLFFDAILFMATVFWKNSRNKE